ncbi:CHASE3 domain-containing protein [Bradyrhizobium sp. CCGUVB23]|uniref:CHASE3 domain-containing protein n=1 Tax=Bradyrhizobium sp. CCGUVB23 TaxID=2949630 RepID=UPI0020B306F5|nr:CHASE3 domain-containing protein [Bradyrhizobium sp. CCGUVB23]MCP3463404.1 CHASE3 domain-containing protein [Bradyrhizobium sp. CCGUVB23]
MNAPFWYLSRPSRVLTLIALAAALTILAGFPLSLNMLRFRENLAWVNHTNEVLRQLSATERALLEAESSERGYLLTADATYLSTYNEWKDAIPALLSSLRGLVTDNTVQQKRVDDLSLDIKARLEELARAVQLGPQRLADVLDILKSARTTQLTPRIIQSLSQLRQTELSLLEARQASADRSGIFATISAAALFVFALISATFGIFIFEHQRTIERERQLQEVQAQLFQLSRLTSVGEMAAAIAHELNQPLAAMMNYLRGSKRLLEGISDERIDKARDALDKAASQSLRAGEVIRRLRDFITQGEITPKVENARTMVEEAVAIALRVANDHTVRVAMQFDGSVTYVLVDKIQIQQVIVNLVRNAIEAMENTVRRELTVSTRAAEDGMVIIKVADSGPGIDPSVAPKLFQPFITSKRNGTGIGLSISRTIVESHGGQMAVDPAALEGTTFYFTVRGVASEKLQSAE